MPKTTKLRIAHLVSHPIQYYVPLYRELSKHADIDLTVYYYSAASLSEYADSGFGTKIKWDVPLTGGYKYILDRDAPKRKLLGEKFDWRPSWSILKVLCVEDFDAIWLNGYAFINSWLATVIGRLRGIPVMLREEQTLLTPRSLLKRIAKRIILPCLYAQVTGLYLGKNGRAFFEHYGTRRLFQVTYGVDNDGFQSQYEALINTRPELRRSFGILDDHPVILFSGKLIDKKQPQLLLESFRRLRATVPCHLLFAGDGSLKEQLLASVQQQKIPDVHFTGFLNQTQLPQAYCAADIFVLPSAYCETWGLVVNEAMNFSLPVIVSDRVGCAADLVQPQRNGFIFPSGDPASLEALLRQLVESSQLRTVYGRQSLEIVKSYSIAAIASQLVEACRAVRNRTNRQPQSLVEEL